MKPVTDRKGKAELECIPGMGMANDMNPTSTSTCYATITPRVLTYEWSILLEYSLVAL